MTSEDSAPNTPLINAMTTAIQMLIAGAFFFAFLCLLFLQ